jgi:hypothetical protein
MTSSRPLKVLAGVVIGLACCFSLTGAAASPDADLTRRTGEIALANWPECEFFVIETKYGFSLATWRSGLWFWDENDAVYGSADETGRHTVLVVGAVMSGEMALEFEETGTNLRRAQKAYYSRCDLQSSAK